MSLTALITGGSRGIGFGIANALAGEGCNLAINGVRPEREVGEALDKLRKLGGEVIYCQGDIGNRDHRRQIIEKAVGHFKTVHVLVNNAGIAPKIRKDMLEITEDGYDELMDVNLKGTYFITQAIANRMIAWKRNDSSYRACVVTISSVSASFASTSRAEYCLSKAGLAMMTKLFAVALGESGIPVYEIRPGLIDTDMVSAVREKYERLIHDGLTLERRWGQPEDIGRIVAALVRGDIPYATGQVITADGGMNLRRF